MPLVVADRVQETSTANTTVSFTLSGAVTGFQSFAVIGNTNTTYYAATDGSGNWEVGVGTYSTTGPTLTRTTILSSSNSGSAVTFSGTVNVFVTYPSGEAVYYQDTGGVVITEAGTADALRVTNTGTGNSFVVEDSANPDASPFVIDASGFIVSGTTAPVNVGGSQSTRFQIHTAGGSQNSGIGLVNWNSVTAQTAIVYLSKSLGGAINTRGIVTSGTILSRISSTGDDGTTFIEAARIDVVVDGTPGTNDMPARLVFSTTPDGASAPTEKMRITSAGNVGIGRTAPSTALDVNGTVTATTFSGSGSSITGVPISTGVSGLGTSVATALAVNVGTAGAVVVNGGALGTPSSGTLTNVSGLPLTTGVTGILGAANGGTGVANNAASTLTISGSFGTTVTVTGTTSVTLPTSGTLATLAGTETFTNKTITARVSSTASITSPLAWNSDNFDQYAATAQSTALTINADAGAPTDGEKIVFRLKDNGTPRALTWTTGSSNSFRAIGVTLPTTTVANKTVYVGCIYNTADSRWDAVAVAQEA